MGVIRFLVHPEGLLNVWPEVHQAYVSALDGHVYPTRVEIDGNVVSCRRQHSESGKVHVAWPVPGFGRPVLSTSTLREQDQPYNLAVELARGKICQVRNQLANWEIAGMKVPAEVEPIHRAAHHLFAQAASVQHQPENASELATAAIAKACQAAEDLTNAYVEQRLMVRRRRSQQLPASLGCNLGRAAPCANWNDLFLPVFNAAAVPIEWSTVEPVEGQYHWDLFDAQIEWCQQHKLIVRGGPLLDMSPGGLPAWLEEWKDDVYNLQSFLCDFVETAVTRYLGRIRIWEVCASVNTGGAFAIGEKDQLTLVAKTVEVARRSDEDADIFIRVNQPWGEYQREGRHGLSPSQFVDALLRCGVGLSGVNLEISVGYRPDGSASRDLLEFSRLIDAWSLLEVPLHVTLAVPSSPSPDERSNHRLAVDAEGWKDGWSEAAQAHWIEFHLPLLLAKQSIVAIYWTHFTDAAPHEFPHAGLTRADGTPKPALEQFTKTRQANWK